MTEADKKVQKSRNARLNLARRSSDALLLQLKQYEGSRAPILEQEFWAEVRDLAADIHVSIHEASAYNNIMAGDSWQKIGGKLADSVEAPKANENLKELLASTPPWKEQ